MTETKVLYNKINSGFTQEIFVIHRREGTSSMELYGELYLFVNKQAFINDAAKMFIGYTQERFDGDQEG
jgi:hypothetical protein